MIQSLLLPLGAAASLGAGALAFNATATAGSAPERPDCPGRITCPQTGEVICADRCPLGAEIPSCCRD